MRLEFKVEEVVETMTIKNLKPSDSWVAYMDKDNLRLIVEINEEN